jgi:hypothetical protein
MPTSQISAGSLAAGSEVIESLLLGAGTDATVNDSIAAFMTGVFADQTSRFLAGGCQLARPAGEFKTCWPSPNRRADHACLMKTLRRTFTPFVAAVATTGSCTPVVVGGQLAGGLPTFTLFDAWANLPNNPGNAGRLSIARGQAVFNKTDCVNWYTVPNLGNNASAGAPGFALRISEPTRYLCWRADRCFTPIRR